MVSIFLILSYPLYIQGQLSLKLTRWWAFLQMWQSSVLNRMMVNVLYAFVPLIYMIVLCYHLENETESCLHLPLPKQQNWWTPFERKVENGREWIILVFGGMKLPVSTTKHPSRGVSFPERLPKETPGFEWIQHIAPGTSFYIKW